MADMPLIDILPDAPTPGMGASAFDTAAFAWVAAQATYRAQLVALADAVNTVAAQVAAVSAQNAQDTWGYPASQSPAANQVPVVKADGSTAFPGGISVGNANANGGAILLDWVERASCTLTATGMTTSPSGTATLVRVGGMVVLTIPVIGGTSNSASFTLTGLPASFRPSGTKVCYVRVIDNGGVIAMGIASIASNGVISLYRGPDGGVWTNTAGAKSIQPSTLSFDI